MDRSEDIEDSGTDRKDGRWTDEEHRKFLEGNGNCKPLRSEETWQGLENDRNNCQDEDWLSDPFTCSEILQ